MTWQMKSFAEIGGHKDQQFLRFIGLPALVGDRFEPAVNGPHDLLRAHGWDTVDAMKVSRTIDRYREFIRHSYAEFGVAKHTYVDSNSGWFSDRTACYLAAGRPVITQDTGFGKFLPTGRGLFAFTTMDDVLAAIDAIEGDYDGHARAAQEIADEYFGAERVVQSLLARAGL
jgi:hypothetical protein